MPIVLDGTNGINTPDLESAGPVSGTTGTFSGAVQASGVATNIYPLVAATAVASTSGTSIDFTGIPSWVKRITVMFSGVSTNGAGAMQVQLGTGGSPTTSGYASGATYVSTTNNLTRGIVSVTTGFRAYIADDVSDSITGSFVITNINSNTWVCNGALLVQGANTGGCNAFGSVALAGALNMLRVTTTTGTPSFDAGTINIMYE